MAATRRNGAPKVVVGGDHVAPPTPLPPTSRSIPSFLLIYPAILLTGSAFSLLDPHARNAPYSTLSQSHPPEVAPSYFAQKRNVFNLYFVKIGWFWFTASYMVFLATRTYRKRSASMTSNGGAEVVQAPGSKERVQGFARWAMATLWWTGVTQWFFGAPLIDRGFRLTGGKCEVLLEQGAKDTKELFTAAACKLAGGAWTGGYDISGHVFLLVLGSAFLSMEVMPVIFASWEQAALAEKDEDAQEAKEALGWPVWFACGVAFLSWWMLLMTSAYFHTWVEKLTGLLVAFAALASIYLLPAILPDTKNILGEAGA